MIAVLRFFRAPAAAWLSDLDEHRLEAGPSVRLDGPAVTVPGAPPPRATLGGGFAGGSP